MLSELYHNYVTAKKQIVCQRQGEQTHADAIIETSLSEHRHVDDAVGRPTNQKEERQKHHVFHSAHDVLGMETDNATGVIPRDKVLCPWNETARMSECGDGHGV